MNPIRVVKVNGLRGDARKGVCYCGREFAGWPASRYGNPFKAVPGFDAVAAFRAWFRGRPRPVVEQDLARLWEDCDHGAKPLGCWCCDWDGVSQPAPTCCHAVVLAELLTEWAKARGEQPTNGGDSC